MNSLQLAVVALEMVGNCRLASRTLERLLVGRIHAHRIDRKNATGMQRFHTKV